ncbi:MAG: hypothetical protein HQK76_05460 [Desulfobacterales bacterium]|nr:hypothetical protein [Desulfobacterales bacterium]
MLLKKYYTVLLILLALLISEIIASVHVYISNVSLYEKLAEILNAGYLILPNEFVMESLKTIKSAFFGGIFFTLTIGSFLSIISVGLVWIWKKLFFGSRLFLLFVLIFFSLFIIVINLNGICFVETLYFIIVPLTVFLVCGKLMLENKGNIQIKKIISLHLLPIGLLSIFWSINFKAELFVNIRDNFLLLNPIGMSINDFYYKYNLYAAESFKSDRQKILKTLYLKDIDTSIKLSIESKLLMFDYIPIRSDINADMVIFQKEKKLILKRKEKEIIKTNIEQLISNTSNILTEFSDKTDKYIFFRAITFYSLILGFPILLYTIIFNIFSIIFTVFSSKYKDILAALICFIVGILFLMPIYFINKKDITLENYKTFLSSNQWQDRVESLKFMINKGIDIKKTEDYQKLMNTDIIPEKYWLIKSLENSSNTYADAAKFLNSKQINILCMAYNVMGKTKNKNAIPLIIERIKNSKNWYEQWYAYKSLRKIGWSQTKSKAIVSQ